MVIVQCALIYLRQLYILKNYTTGSTCNTVCSVNGGWSEWEYGACNQHTGMRSGSRVCNNPSPKYGGRLCDGSPTSIEECLVNGIFTFKSLVHKANL